MFAHYGFVVLQMFCVSADFACEYQPVDGRVLNTMAECNWELDRHLSSGRYRKDELKCSEVQRRISP